ncbi:MAG: hypothetical protein JKY96_00175 [Phycisphaerales bacterium]|nr:hypothetical protein [Phycisphaerales bacterium]
MPSKYTSRNRVLFPLVGAVLLVSTGCGEMLQRRVDVTQPSGVDETIDDRFDLNADAQDPSKRDRELGYGRWKGKPETKGTAEKTSRTRRGETWTP